MVPLEAYDRLRWRIDPPRVPADRRRRWALRTAGKVGLGALACFALIVAVRQWEGKPLDPTFLATLLLAAVAFVATVGLLRYFSRGRPVSVAVTTHGLRRDTWSERETFQFADILRYEICRGESDRFLRIDLLDGRHAIAPIPDTVDLELLRDAMNYGLRQEGVR